MKSATLGSSSTNKMFMYGCVGLLFFTRSGECDKGTGGNCCWDVKGGWGVRGFGFGWAN